MLRRLSHKYQLKKPILSQEVNMMKQSENLESKCLVPTHKWSIISILKSNYIKQTNKKADMKQSTKYETNSIKNARKELCSLPNQTLNDVVTWHWKKLVN